ncbi:hypothetical protein GCM10010404_50190 [Nonomuraea africana]|uniref:Uncharacterized protein n=1 Tax=Nonomuraea africana TaxID=46171 RepID=A0ABR9KVI3_9ACTN|nr:hypothetical protein [Nonomuraea africana]MBE1566013.1 hypothetical protein [Nonomuraea africana]
MEAAASGPVTAEAKYLREVRQTIQLALQVTLARQGYEVCCDPLSGEVIVPACPATGHAARPCLTGGLRPRQLWPRHWCTPCPKTRWCRAPVTGAVFGVVAMIWLHWAQNPDMDGPGEIDRALAHLESGLRL